ncbi:MAG: oligoribonuclease [Candidatus Westeberhardia cardiocondylae]|nr:oligoribonuclease [Candidatus Westeberhardia cardiocondylae]
MSFNVNNLIWIDLEMTGLNPDHDRIIEIATLVTDMHLNILSEGPVLAIHQSSERLAMMDKWNTKIHTASGLIDKVRSSDINEELAVIKTLSFLSNWVPFGKSPICGNTIAQDRRFLFRYMPSLEAYFHYHYLDVSSIKELVRRWKPEILLGFKKKNTHRALSDIRESVEEMLYYRDHFIQL